MIVLDQRDNDGLEQMNDTIFLGQVFKANRTFEGDLVLTIRAKVNGSVGDVTAKLYAYDTTADEPTGNLIKQLSFTPTNTDIQPIRLDFGNQTITKDSFYIIYLILLRKQSI